MAKTKKSQKQDSNLSKPQSDHEMSMNIADNGELNFKADKKHTHFVPSHQSNTPFQSTRIVSLIVAAIVIGITLYFSFHVIPNIILANTDEAVASKSLEYASRSAASKSASMQALLEKENQELSFTNQKVFMSFENFGDIVITLKDTAAPKNVENFIRLVSRDYYNNTTIHRMVEGPAFNVIQGGDPTGTGTGGETATGEPLPDEIWSVPPEFRIASDDPNRETKLVNTPQFTDAALYPGYSAEVGLVNFPRGLVLMANTGAPDSATSQFFITLDQTVLPPSYTVFGVIDDFNSLQVLDLIKNEVDPVPDSDSGDNKDGKPDTDIRITTARIAREDDVTQVVSRSSEESSSEDTNNSSESES